MQIKQMEIKKSMEIMGFKGWFSDNENRPGAVFSFDTPCPIPYIQSPIAVASGAITRKPGTTNFLWIEEIKIGEAP
jgi:hypothetical protein